MRTLGGILAGGFSRRMGRPKHLIEVDGVSLLAIAAKALGPHCDEVFLLGAVENWSPDAPAMTCIPDLPGVRGPIAGIGAAMLHSPHDRWVIMACDMPKVTSDDVQWLLAQQNEASATPPVATMPWVDDRPLPTFAIYMPQASVAVAECVAASRGPISLGRRPDVHTPVPPEATRLVNVNTPKELGDFVSETPLGPIG